MFYTLLLSSIYSFSCMYIHGVYDESLDIVGRTVLQTALRQRPCRETWRKRGRRGHASRSDCRGTGHADSASRPLKNCGPSWTSVCEAQRRFARLQVDRDEVYADHVDSRFGKKNECFLDSNVLLYLLDITSAKRPLALQLARRSGVHQRPGLNEFADVASAQVPRELRRRLPRAWHRSRRLRVVPAHSRVHDWPAKSSAYSPSHIRCLHVALPTCRQQRLYTEDLSHGQRIGRVP